MDPDYEQRLLHVQNGQQSPFGSVRNGPSSYTVTYV